MPNLAEWSARRIALLMVAAFALGMLLGSGAPAALIEWTQAPSPLEQDAQRFFEHMQSDRAAAGPDDPARHRP